MQNLQEEIRDHFRPAYKKAAARDMNVRPWRRGIAAGALMTAGMGMMAGIALAFGPLTLAAVNLTGMVFVSGFLLTMASQVVTMIVDYKAEQALAADMANGTLADRYGREVIPQQEALLESRKQALTGLKEKLQGDFAAATTHTSFVKALTSNILKHLPKL